MRLLLDTHVLIWMFSDDSRLTADARELLLDEDNILYCSVVSIWEVALKHGVRPEENIGPTKFVEYCDASHIKHLDLKREHVLPLEDMPAIHGDPFDRLLIAQSSAERMTLVTHDANIRLYPYKNIKGI